jgi:CubicO group peptidase (beta-lactamase class C family)
LAALAVPTSSPAVGHAQAADPRPSQSVPDLEASLDSLLKRRMEADHLSGVAVAVVREGEILLLRGYGVADRETGRPVDPERTLFRVASVSKPVTATAVMQLVEKDRLDLNADLRAYLPELRRALSGSEPLTMRHLLTHTAALDERALRRSTRDSAQIKSLAAWLSSHPPRRIGVPGRVISYNDVGYTLAGRVVEAVSETPFPRYVEERVFAPLGMQRTSFEQLLPDSLLGALATGYDFRRGEHHRVPHEYVHQTPPAGMMTTAADMAKFLIAHLEGGRHGGTRILADATIQEMQRRQFSMDPRLQGAGYGFWEIRLRGQRGLWHGGDWNGYGAVLLMLPEQRAGVFAAFNGRSARLPDELMGWFAAQMVPDRLQPVLPIPAAVGTDVRHLVGTYRFSRYSRSSMATLPTILSGQAPESRVTPNASGGLTIFGERWIEVEPLLFRRADGRGPALRFVQGAAGRSSLMALNGFETLERVPWYGSVRFHLALLGLSLLSFVAVLASAGVHWARRWRSTDVESEPSGAHRARVALVVVAATGALFLVGVGAALARINPLDFMAEIPAWTVLLLSLPILTAVLTVSLPIFVVRAWRGHYWNVPGRIAYSVASLVAVVFVVTLAYWNLLGFRF